MPLDWRFGRAAWRLAADDRGKHPPDGAVFAECVIDYEVSPLSGAQLQRRRDFRQEGADRAVDSARRFACGRVDGDDSPAGVSGYSGDARLDERAGRGGRCVLSSRFRA